MLKISRGVLDKVSTISGASLLKDVLKLKYKNKTDLIHM